MKPYFRQLPSVLSALTLLALSASCENNVPANKHSRPDEATTPFMNLYEPDRLKEVARIASDSDADLVFLGDSITQGWLKNGKEVWDKFYGDRRALNFGIGMAETGNLLWRINAGHFDIIQPRLIVLLIGTNNSQYSKHTPQQISEGVATVVKELLIRQPKTKILLLGIFPRGTTTDDPYRLNNEATNRLIARIGDGEQIFFRDISEVFLRPDRSVIKELMADPVHLNRQGYLRWAEAMEKDIKQLLGE